MKSNFKYALFWSITMTIIFWFFSNLFRNDFKLAFLKDGSTLASIVVIFILFYIAGFIIAILKKNNIRN